MRTSAKTIAAAVVGVLLSAHLHAQTGDALLVRMGGETELGRQLEFLEQAVIGYGAEGRVEDALELAAVGTDVAVDHEMDSMAVRLLVLSADMARRGGDADQALTFEMKAHAIAEEGVHGLVHITAMRLAESMLEAGAAARSLELSTAALMTGALSDRDEQRATYLQASGAQRTGQLDLAASLFSEAVSLAAASGMKDAHIQAMMGLSEVLTATGAWEDALVCEQALIGMLDGRDGAAEARVRNNEGKLLLLLGRPLEALSAFYAARSFLGSGQEAATVLMNIAAANAMLERTAQAEAALAEAARLLGPDGPPVKRAELLNIRSGVLLMAGNWSLATTATASALDAAKRANDEAVLEEALLLAARAAKERNDEQAMRAVEHELNDLRDAMRITAAKKGRAVEELGYGVQRKEREARGQVAEARLARIRTERVQLRSDNEKKMAEIFRVERELQESRLAQEILARSEAQNALRLMQARLDAETNSRTIEQLESSRAVQALRMSELEMGQKQRETSLALLKRQNELMAQQKRADEAESERNKLVANMSMAAAVLMVLALVFLYWVSRKIKTKSKQVHQKSKEIAQINADLALRNEEHQSSLRYAKNIQSLIIPTEQALQAALPGATMLYRPKDVVSGDLPFVFANSQFVYVAAIDCTGHGVPAAMLSFMAYYSLSEIILRKRTGDPGTILDALHDRIVSSKDRSAQDTRFSDAMDIGLCRVDRQTGEVLFSGSGMSMIVAGGGSVSRIRGEQGFLGDVSMQHGGSHRNHIAPASPGTSFYLYSDGLVDQFGGLDGRKRFSHKRLTGTLEATTGADPGTNVLKLAEVLGELQLDQPQTDDILLIGFSTATTALSNVA